MVTQIQDVANQVSQDKISNSRLRNEEMRKQMYNPWSEPVDAVKQTPTGTTLTNITQPVAGVQPTLASTYSGLKNNWDSLGLNSTTSSGSTTPNTTTSAGGNWKTQGWAPMAAGTVAGLMGAGPYAGLASAATAASQGNKAGAVGSLTSSLASLFGSGKIPGLTSAIGTIAGGLMGDKSMSDIGMSLANSGIGTVLGLANPVVGVAYNVARALGVDPAYGLNNLFGTGMQGVAPGFGGTAGGFLGKNAVGQGISSTMNNTPYSSSSGTSGYSPPGYTSSDNGSGITTGSQTGISGGLSNSYSWGNSSGTSQTSASPSGYSGYSYSGPGSSVGTGGSSDSGDD